MVMLFDSHACDPGLIPAGSIYSLNLFYLLFGYFLCALFGGVMALFIFQCRTVLHLDARVWTCCADLLTFRMFCFTLCRLLNVFVLGQDVEFDCICCLLLPFHLLCKETRTHRIPASYHFWRKQFDTGKQLFTWARNISRVSYFAVFITSKQ